MKKTAIISAHAPKPIGPYNQAIAKGNHLFVSGQIAIDPKTNQLNIPDNITDESQLVLSNLKALVEEAGFSLDDVVKCSIFMKNLNQFDEVNAVYARFFQDIPPARECVEVSKLPKNVNVEISCIAIKS
ncbi:MAG: Rid family detoxifying hydrolase [Flavobacteriales bacterium]